MKIPAFIALAALLAAALAGCGGADHTLRYTFEDGGRYQVDMDLRADNRLVKSHGGKPFTDKRDRQFIRATYRLQMSRLPEGMLAADFYLKRMRIHTQDGHFTLEIGPENGWVSWYGEGQTLRDYLGAGDFELYGRAVRKPMASLRLNRRGQQSGSDQRFNEDVFRLLGRNPVIGQQVLKSMRVPPVLAAVFPEGPAGRSWVYQGQAPLADGEETREGATAFTYRTRGERVQVAFSNRVDFTPQDLAGLARRIGLPESSRLSFDRSYFSIQGEVAFRPDLGRPERGRMQVAKEYGLKLPEETWRLSQSEDYAFSVTKE